MNILEYIEKLRSNGRGFKFGRQVRTKTDRIREYLIAATGKNVASVGVGMGLVGLPRLVRGDGKIKPTGHMLGKDEISVVLPAEFLKATKERREHLISQVVNQLRVN